MGLPRHARLSGGAAFRRALRGRWRRSGRWLTVSAAPNSCGFSRLGLVFGRRQLPLAVHRNRLKRVARVCFRRCLARVGGVDLVVKLHARPEAQQLTALEAELRALLGSFAANSAASGTAK